MEDQIVTFITAKLARQKGFKENSLYCYDKNAVMTAAVDYTGRLYFDEEDTNNAEENGYSSYLAPTQSLLQKWLREEHNIFISIIYHKTKKHSIIINDECENDIFGCFGEFYNTYEQALEKGLQEALKLI